MRHIYAPDAGSQVSSPSACAASRSLVSDEINIKVSTAGSASLAINAVASCIESNALKFRMSTRADARPKTLAVNGSATNLSTWSCISTTAYFATSTGVSPENWRRRIAERASNCANSETILNPSSVRSSSEIKGADPDSKMNSLTIALESRKYWISSHPGRESGSAK